MKGGRSLWSIYRYIWYHETSPHDSMNISRFLIIKCTGKNSWVINLICRNFLVFWASRFDEVFLLIFCHLFLFNLRFWRFCTPWKNKYLRHLFQILELIYKKNSKKLLILLLLKEFAWIGSNCDQNLPIEYCWCLLNVVFLEKVHFLFLFSLW